MHNTACSLREIKRNVINFWLVWSKFEEEANKSMSGLRWYHLMMYEYILSHCTNQVDNRLEPVVFYMLGFMSLDPDLEQVFIEAEP